MKTSQNPAHQPERITAAFKLIDWFDFTGPGLADITASWPELFPVVAHLVDSIEALLLDLIETKSDENGVIPLAEALLIAQAMRGSEQLAGNRWRLDSVFEGLQRFHLRKCTARDFLVLLLSPIWNAREDLARLFNRVKPQPDYETLMRGFQLIAIAETFLFHEGCEIGVKTVCDPRRPTKWQQLATEAYRNYLVAATSKNFYEPIERSIEAAKEQGRAMDNLAPAAPGNILRSPASEE